ncbi:hypothetical protein EI555_001987, partial [Monodon monoceros]
TLRLQKRLASSVLCGSKRKVWLDAVETTEIFNANSQAYDCPFPGLKPEKYLGLLMDIGK